MDKNALRSVMRSLPQNLSGGEKVLARLETVSGFRDSDTVLLYSSISGEVDTAGFISKWSSFKRIVLPRVKGAELELREYDPKKIEYGYRGIIEPTCEAELVPPDRIGLALVPGLAFDPCGGRLGRGKGYYDTLLRHLNCIKVGIAYDERIVPEVPMESHDVKMDMVITPNYLYICRK